MIDITNMLQNKKLVILFHSYIYIKQNMNSNDFTKIFSKNKITKSLIQKFLHLDGKQT